MILLLIYVLIFRSWTTFGDILYPGLELNEKRPFYYSYQLSIFLSYFLHFIVLLIFIRCWFIYYDWQRNAQLLSLQWKKLLRYNSSIIKKNNRLWTLTCKPYLGNMQFLISVAIFLFFITELTVIITPYASSSGKYDEDASFITQCIILTFFTIIGIFLFHRSLKLKDCIGIRGKFNANPVCTLSFLQFSPKQVTTNKIYTKYIIYKLINFSRNWRTCHFICIISDILHSHRHRI